MTARAQRTRDRANGIVCDQTPFARVIRVALRRYGAGEGETGAATAGTGDETDDTAICGALPPRSKNGTIKALIS